MHTAAILTVNLPFDGQVLYFAILIIHEQQHCLDDLSFNHGVHVKRILLELIHQVIESHVTEIPVLVAHLQ